MGQRETGGRNATGAQRLRRLRTAVVGDNSSEFARRLGISAKRWSNFENGYPLSREVALKLVQIVPGVTLDWLYLGKIEGLTVDLARRLGLLEAAEHLSHQIT
jgi:transcriptional regulator with XRE-family HTH domain